LIDTLMKIEVGVSTLLHTDRPTLSRFIWPSSPPRIDCVT